MCKSYNKIDSTGHCHYHYDIGIPYNFLICFCTIKWTTHIFIMMEGTIMKEIDLCWQKNENSHFFSFSLVTAFVIFLTFFHFSLVCENSNIGKMLIENLFSKVKKRKNSFVFMLEEM